MDNTKRFVVGSKAFFSSFDDFSPRDSDILIILDSPPKKMTYQHVKLNHNDYFIYKRMSKKEFIDYCVTSKLPIRIGMFLVPEFIEYMGVTIEDLDLLQNVISHIDDKHTYEKIIYDSYKKNNGFYLTEEQLEEAYKDYKSKR